LPQNQHRFPSARALPACRNDQWKDIPPLTSPVLPSIYVSPGRVRAFGVGATMTERSSEGLDERRRKLLFRAWRRGVREMDLIVGRFADAHIAMLDAAALEEFERLIEVPNAALYAWVIGAERVPADYDTAVLAKLRAFHDRTQPPAAAEEK
jgi:antitoxin CptB